MIVLEHVVIGAEVLSGLMVVEMRSGLECLYSSTRDAMMILMMMVVVMAVVMV